MKLLDYFFFVLTRLNLISPLHPSPGHLKPFGSVGPLIHIKELPHAFPSETKLLTYYIPQAEPVLSRQVLNEEGHFSIWQTDDKLKDGVDGLAQTNIEVETLKSRQRQRVQMTFGDFLSRVGKEPVFYANDVPQILQKYLVVPKPLQCEAVRETFQSALMIISTPNASPLLINEENAHFHCILRGSKRLVLVDSRKYPEVRSIVVPEKQEQIRPFVNPDRVDFNQFPALADIDHHLANLTAGDCLFVPSDWIFQERSSENTISVIYNIRDARARTIDANDLKNCPAYDPAFTLDQVDWSVERHPQSFKDLMMNLVKTKTHGLEKWQRAFSKHLAYEIESDPEVASIFEEFYGIVDVDADGQITSAEFDQINGAHQHHIVDLLSEMAKMIHKKRKLSATKPVTVPVDQQPLHILTEDELIHLQNYKSDL